MTISALDSRDKRRVLLSSEDEDFVDSSSLLFGRFGSRCEKGEICCGLVLGEVMKDSIV